MKKLLLFLAIGFAVSTELNAQGLTIPQPSPGVKVRQNFATSYIDLNYSRPGVKGRKIFGSLVPYDKVWRTGANGATKIGFGEEVSVNGVKIPKGRYGLLTIPGKTEWTIILSKDTTVTSAADYKQENDIVRVITKPRTTPALIETFTIDVTNIKPNQCDVIIMWEKIMVSFTVTADIDTKIMAQIDEAMKGEKKPYYQAANYYYENGKDLDKALEWVNLAIADRPEAYWIVLLKAKIQLKKGDYAGAIETASKSKELAQKDENPDYVKMSDEVIAQAKKMQGGGGSVKGEEKKGKK